MAPERGQKRLEHVIRLGMRVHGGYQLLRTALKYAAKKRLIPCNPALDVPPPRTVKAEMTVYHAGQVAVFLKAAQSDRLYALYALALDSGMRQGELFALQWPDFDFEGGSVEVQRSLEERKGKHRLKEPKTPTARRRIDLSRFAVAVMPEHRKRMLAEGHVAGPVFCDTDGGFLRKSNVQHYSFKPTIMRANEKILRCCVWCRSAACVGGTRPRRPGMPLTLSGCSWH